MEIPCRTIARRFRRTRFSRATSHSPSTIFGAAPSAVSIVLQTAMIDSDAQYAAIDTSAATTGEARTVTGVRAKVSSITGGSGVIVQILG